MGTRNLTNSPAHYFENLDSLRFFSFLAVFLYHSFYTEIPEIKSSAVYSFVKYDLFGNGNLGVNFFFVLSGFLITFLLLTEKSIYQKISIVDFWMRRILRIWPLYFACVLFGFLFVPWIKSLLGEASLETANPFSYVFFVSNFDIIRKGLPDASNLSVLWSIAIEEQFYFVWPLLLAMIKEKQLLVLFSGIILSSLIFRALYPDPVFYELHTFSCMGDLAAGGLGALAVLKWRIDLKFASLSRIQIALIYFVFFFLFFFRGYLVNGPFPARVIERPLISFSILFIILEQNYSTKSFLKVGKSGLFTALGKISYGLYCLHFIGIILVTRIAKMIGINTSPWEVICLETAVSLLLTMAMAWLSYNYFEKPFLLKKRVFSKI